VSLPPDLARAYERGRVLDAALGALPVVALPLGVLAVAGLRPGQAGLALALMVGAGALFWRGEGWGAAARLGLVAGVLPLVAALAPGLTGMPCAGPDCPRWCATICTLGGLSGGAWLGWRGRGGWAETGVAAGIAAMTGWLGCAPMGMGTLAGVVLGLAAGAVTALLGRRWVSG
jgi:hypothetical protein